MSVHQPSDEPMSDPLVLRATIRSHGASREDAERMSLPAVYRKVWELDPSLEETSPLFRAAVLLLAAPGLGYNVARLSRLTGYPHDFVARCARRLVDNGVWVGGATICGWTDDGTGAAAFRADARVALGQLCRRTERDTIEWAPAGYWMKHVDYAAASPEERLAIRYDAPPPDLSPEIPLPAHPEPEADPMAWVSGSRTFRPDPEFPGPRGDRSAGERTRSEPRWIGQPRQELGAACAAGAGAGNGSEVLWLG